jgi:hypothetical protein
LSSFFVAFALGRVLAGPLSDRFGRKRLVLGGLAVFAAGSVLCAFADTLSFLILGRVIQALGACTASVLSRAIARDLFDGEALARALAMTMIAGAAAPGFSPLLGSALDLFGWRITFLVVAAFGVVLALHYSRRVGETHPADRRASLAASAVASAYGRLAVDPRFLLPAVSVSLVIGGLYTFFTAAPAILMSELGLTVAGFLAPRLAHRWGQRTVGMIGLFIALAGGLFMFAFASAPAFNELKARGLNDILIAVIDGLKGFPEAITTVFPQTIVQTCIVHLIRNSLAFVSWKDRKAIMPSVKAIYRAEAADIALTRLEEFETEWASAIRPSDRSGAGPGTMSCPSSPSPRESYTTNAVEALNRSLRKIIKTRGSFPNDEAALKLLYLATKNAGLRWRRGVEWTAAMGQFAIQFGDRFPGAAH